MKAFKESLQVSMYALALLWALPTNAQPAQETNAPSPSVSEEERPPENHAQPAQETSAPSPSVSEERPPENHAQPAQETSAPSPSVSEAQSPKDTPQKNMRLQLQTADGNFMVRPNLLLQPTITVPLDDDATWIAEGSGLQVKRANLGFRGTLFKLASYRLWVGFGKGVAKLIDAWVDINPWEGRLVIRAGWFVPPFGRQRLASSSKLQFVEPSMAWSDKKLGLNLNRDMGITMYGLLADAVEWGVGATNGENSYTIDDTNRDFSAAARLVFHPLAALGTGDVLKTLDTTTLKTHRRPALALGGSVMVVRRKDRALVLDAESEPTKYKDRQVKIGGEMGFSWSLVNVSGELFWMKTVLDDDQDSAIVSAVKAQRPRSADTDGKGMGAYVQAGLMVISDRFEIAGRFDWVDEHRRTSGSRFYPAFAANVYLRGHNLKLQSFYRANISHGYKDKNPTSHLVELMLQLCF